MSCNRYPGEHDNQHSDSEVNRSGPMLNQVQMKKQSPEHKIARVSPSLGKPKVIPAIMPPPITGAEIWSKKIWEQARADMFKQTNQNLIKIAGYRPLWEK